MKMLKFVPQKKKKENAENILFQSTDQIRLPKMDSASTLGMIPLI